MHHNFGNDDDDDDAIILCPSKPGRAVVQPVGPSIVDSIVNYCCYWCKL